MYNPYLQVFFDTQDEMFANFVVSYAPLTQTYTVDMQSKKAEMSQVVLA